MKKPINYFRPYQTLYYDTASTAGKPVAMGFAASFFGARRALVVHLAAAEDHKVGVVVQRESGNIVSIMRPTGSGLSIDNKEQ